MAYPASGEQLCSRTGEPCQDKTLMFAIADSLAYDLPEQAAEALYIRLEHSCGQAKQLCRPAEGQCGLVRFGGLLAILREASVITIDESDQS